MKKESHSVDIVIPFPLKHFSVDLDITFHMLGVRNWAYLVAGKELDLFASDSDSFLITDDHFTVPSKSLACIRYASGNICNTKTIDGNVCELGACDVWVSTDNLNDCFRLGAYIGNVGFHSGASLGRGI